MTLNRKPYFSSKKGNKKLVPPRKTTLPPRVLVAFPLLLQGSAKGYLLYLLGSSAQTDIDIKVELVFRRQVQPLTACYTLEVMSIKSP